MPSLYRRFGAVYADRASRAFPSPRASQLLQEQDRIIRSFPEVESVFGTVGRSDSATDNAPLDMYDTTIMLKPQNQWPPGMTYEKLIREMDDKLQFPGLSNTWTMPVENRLDMELTGIKTPVGHEDSGAESRGDSAGGRQYPADPFVNAEVRSIFAEKAAEGFYVNINVDRAEAARYGLTIADVQRAVESGIGGEDIAVNIEGRDRYPVNVRYNRDFRGDLGALRNVVMATPTGAQIPIGEVANDFLFTRPFNDPR